MLSDPEHIPSFEELYPHLEKAALDDARARLEEYIALIIRIYERVTADPETHAILRRLTASQRSATRKVEE